MKRHKSIIVFLLLTTLLLTGCKDSSPKTNTNSGDKKISIVATIFPGYDFARAIAGDHADVTMLLPPASESHSYEPTPQDTIKIQDCDLFIYTGGESDTWVKTILDSMDTSKMTIIKMMDCVKAVEEETVEGMEAEEEHGDEEDGEEEPEYDEHVWTSPQNAKLIVQKISDAMCSIDSANAKAYQDNTAAYLSQLDELDTAFKKVVAEGSRKTLIFGDRFPFRYFADAYGLKYYAAFPGCSTESDASAKTVSFLIDKVKSEHIPVVFHIELSNEKMANTICEATGAKKLLLHACHNISKTDFENGKTYLDLMNQNVEALKEALN